MTGIILAGGLGTRLRSVLHGIPKCLAPVNNIPFLTFILKKLSRSGFNKVVLSVGYLKEKIIKYYGNKFINLEIVYSSEDAPLGTGGAIIQALKLVKEEFVYVLNGDTFFDIDFDKINDESKDFIIAGNFVSDVSRYGELIINENRVINFLEKGNVKKGLINGGIYFLKKSAIDNYKFPLNFSWEKDFLKKFLNVFPLYCVSFSELFIDIGIPEDYRKAQILLKNYE